MDWAKAKTILIIALLLVCLVLGGILAAQSVEESRQDKASAQYAEEYLKDQGASLICDIPLSRPALPVLFVHFNKGTINHTAILEEYKGIEVVVPQNNLYVPELSSAGKARAKVITASSALLNAAAQAGNLKGLEISEIKLVYYVDPDGFNPNAEDTAVPCWKITTNNGNYFINAYNL